MQTLTGDELTYTLIALNFQLDHDDGESSPPKDAGEEAYRKLGHINPDGNRISTNTITVFAWNNDHGACGECGLPAAFYLPLAYAHQDEGPTDTNKRCAVCAANAAAEGEIVRRIDEEGS